MYRMVFFLFRISWKSSAFDLEWWINVKMGSGRIKKIPIVIFVQILCEFWTTRYRFADDFFFMFVDIFRVLVLVFFRSSASKIVLTHFKLTHVLDSNIFYGLTFFMKEILWNFYRIGIFYCTLPKKKKRNHDSTQILNILWNISTNKKKTTTGHIDICPFSLELRAHPLTHIHIHISF